MHAPPRERLFVLLVSAATVVGFVLASDDDNWTTTSVCLTLAAVALSLVAHAVDDERVEQAAALAWWLAIVVGVRWITVPAVWVPLAGVTLGGLPFVVAREFRGRRAEIRSAHARCVECGYDLRSTAERCPECGTTINPEVERLRRIAAELRSARSRGHSAFRRPSSSTPIPVADASDGPR